MKFRYKSTYMFSLFILCGCSSSINLVNKEEYKNVVQQCYQLARPSFLYTSSRCKNNERLCLGIQVFGSQSNVPDKNRQVPNSEKELTDDLKYWNEKVATSALIRKRQIIASIPEGTRFDIVGLFHEQYGTMGTYWYVQIKLKDSEIKQVVELPTNYYLIQPPWLADDGSLSFDDSFVTSCDDK